MKAKGKEVERSAANDRRCSGAKPRIEGKGVSPMKVFQLVEDVLGGWVVTATLVVMTSLITAEVLGRAIFNHSFAAVSDIVQVCMVVVAYAGLSIVERKDMNLKIDLLTERLAGTRVGDILYCLAVLLSLVTVGVITFATLRQTVTYARVHAATPGASVPYLPFSLFVPLGFTLLAIRFVAMIGKRLMTVARR